MSGINSRREAGRRLIHLAVIATWALVFSVSRFAYAQEVSELADGSDIEKRAWAQLQKDGKAELKQDEVISAKFIEDLVTGKLVSPTLKRKGVTIEGGSVEGPVELRNYKIDLPIVHLATEIKKKVDISDSEFSGSVSFQGARLLGELKASRAVIAGSFLLGELDDTRWYDQWVADRGPTFPVISKLTAPHLRLRGDLVVAGASIPGRIDLSNSDISGTVTLMHLVSRSVDPAIDISASKIDNQLIIYDCAIYRPAAAKASEFLALALYDIKINQTVYITRSLVEGKLDISDAVIAGDLNFRGSELSQVHARGAKVSGAFMLGVNTVKPWIPTRWREPSALNLAGARFGAVRAPEMPDVWPAQIDFQHFSTTLFSQAFCGADADICQHSPTWYATLLQRQATPRPSYEPYKQISEMLVSQGALQEAESLSVRGRDVMRDDALRHHEWLSYIGMLFYGWTVGYGYHPEYAIYWAIFFTIVGALIFRKTQEAAQNHMPYGLAYSFDMLLPIVHLREKHYQIDLAGSQRYYFYFHKLVGWALGLLLAAVMAGITR